MYSQSTQAMSRKRYSYGTTPDRNRRRPSQERVRLLQLTVCLVLFLAIFLWKGVFPHKLERLRDNMFALITTDLNIQETLAGLSESLAGGDTILSDFEAFCVEVFGIGGQEETMEPATFTPLPLSADMRKDELRFLSQGLDVAACTAHYADLDRYGLQAVSLAAEPETADQGEEELPAEPITPEEPPAVPAAGTVIMASDYSGDELPNNYTMDQLSLGELDTVTPVVGRLNSGYGYRDHPINGRYHFHGGVDISGKKGDPIAAFAAGTVEYIGEDDSYGQYLQIDHGNGVKSFYAHCSRVLVSKGQAVALGEKVAEIGSTGTATGPHLHLELKYVKMHLNPAYYVDFLER